ncbi:hypothetical protein O181_033930 [Austropuccinia psidii MF-1]|uniref:Uncharacterized protein n=1 Tax=Austropuccinia psidii MF-1 TaxID=1389203 RepID=A0A9Q3H9P6_9BASI|nr:hypothetical protein [Austropuccinia psidii MF-1]
MLRFVEPFSKEEYINAMEDIITRKRIGKMWIMKPVESKIMPKNYIEYRSPERIFFKCHRCRRTSNLGKNFTKKTKIYEVQCNEEKEESYQDSDISDDTPVEECHTSNITALFEDTELHTNLP